MFFNKKKGVDETSLKYAVGEYRKSGKGSNAAYIYLMLNYVRNQNPVKYKYLTRAIGRLKILRTNADYSEIMLTRTESEEAMKLARSVKSELKEIIRI